ncbi:hypothetical protein O3M35_001220 [Rhynocoris fuscipes]|uniref:Fringe-like glycosyltransferase domain-containing protein n=1 Tax=Rhynocoris fuscipes TaxID=488301 RepID=A0AAW1DQY7_9HEMI
MKFIKQETFHEQITFSYSRYSKDEMNVVRIDGFDTRIDPTRLVNSLLFICFKIKNLITKIYSQENYR